MRERGFELAVRKVNGEVVGDGSWGIDDSHIPVYKTTNSAGADFMCAEDVVIPSSWTVEGNLKPTLVHTGIKAYMLEDEVLELYNRSSNPSKIGLVLANSVGVVDSDYYSCDDNDGEIMFTFYNFFSCDVVIKKGERIGQGVFKKFLRPDKAVVDNSVRVGGFGSTES